MKMKAVSLFLTLIIIENGVFQLQPLAAFDRAKRHVRLGNYNYYYKWRPKDCKSVYDNYDPGFTRQHDIALFNATPSAQDMTQKYQVMYFPKESKMPGRSTLVSSPFLFYKLLLPKPQKHANGIENLANTGAHLFPTEAPTAADMPAVTDMMPPAVTDMMPTMPTAPPAMGNMNVQTRGNLWQTRQRGPINQNLLNNYRNNRPSNYVETNRIENYAPPDLAYNFFNENFAQLAYLQNNPKNFNVRYLVEQMPSFSKSITQANEKKYLPIKPLSYEEEQYFPIKTLHMEYFEPPFKASPFMGMTAEKSREKPPADFFRSQHNPYISRRSPYNF